MGNGDFVTDFTAELLNKREREKKKIDNYIARIQFWFIYIYTGIYMHAWILHYMYTIVCDVRTLYAAKKGSPPKANRTDRIKKKRAR